MNLPALSRQPAFRSLWLAGLVSDTGDWLLFIALPVVVYQLTGSALGTSFAFLVELVPGIVLAPLAGWCADRWDRRRVLIVVSGVQAVALVPLLVVRTGAELPVVYAVILLEAALFTLFDPTKNALMPALVPREDLVSANSLVGLGQNLARLVGGPLGGALLAAGGLRVVVASDLVSYLLAAVLIGRIAAPASTRSIPHDGRPGPQNPAGPAWYRSMLDSRLIRAALLVNLVSQIAQGIFVVLFILFVAQRLHGGSSEIGLLRGVQAVGAIVGGVVLATVARRHAPGTLTAGAALAFGIVDLVLWNAPLLSTNLALYVGLFIVIGAPGIVLGTGLVSALQIGADDTNRGRVFGAFGLTGNLGQAVGMLAAGLLTSRVGLLSILNLQAMLYLAAGGVAAWSMTDRLTRRRRPARAGSGGSGGPSAAAGPLVPASRPVLPSRMMSTSVSNNGRYTHGHEQATLASHSARTAANSAAYLLPVLAPGMSVLDAGCGPGTITLDLAEIVAPGPVVGVENVQAPLVAARGAATRRGDHVTRFEVADVLGLPYDDDSFDVVHAHQVLQHLTDPVGALAEMARVCKPGGWVAARDADYAAMTWYPELPELEEWRRVYRAVARANGAEPDAGRRVRAWATAAGLTGARFSASVWNYAEPDVCRWWGNGQAERCSGPTFAAQAAEQGRTDADLEAIAAAWRAWGESPEAWFAIVHGELLAQLPE